MQVLPNNLPTTVAELQQLLLEKQSVIEQQQKELASSRSRNKVLEEKLRLLNQKHFAKSSEKNPGQAELQFLNEAEMLHSQAVLDEAQASDDDESDDGIVVGAHTRKRAKKRRLPSELPRCDVIHDLSDEQKQCACGLTMSVIGEEVLEQLAIVPQQFYVIVHRKLKYACSCKSCMRTASMPVQPLPGSQASPQMMAHVMVSKFHDGCVPRARGSKGLEIVRNFTIDEGLAPRSRLAGAGFKPLQAAGVKSLGGERCSKRYSIDCIR